MRVGIIGTSVDLGSIVVLVSWAICSMDCEVTCIGEPGCSPKSRHTLGKFGKWLFILLIFGTELAMCQCCSRRTAEKDVGDGKDAARTAIERE